MIIEKVDPERECFSDYSLIGDRLTIGNVIIDLTAEQDDQETIVTLSQRNGIVRRGLSPSCVYVAEVVIPPQRHEHEEVEGENGDVTITVTPLPLDTESVTLRLWPVVDEADSEINYRHMEEANVSE